VTRQATGRRIERSESRPLEVAAVAGEDRPLRIGEVAERSGLTTRTLRYWEEIGLLQPVGYRDSGERLYSPEELGRVTHIRELQELLGLTLAEIGAVLKSEDALDRARQARHSGAPIAHRLRLLEEAIDAHDRLVERIDDRLQRITAFRDEWVAKGERMKDRAEELRSGQSKVVDR
jgi:MerR family transcriptional regulator, repressor of the yfmOP operon